MGTKTETNRHTMKAKKKPSQPKKMGRPSLFTPELATEICNQIALGKSLRAICREPDKPDKLTVLRWLAANEDFRTQYAHARDLQADHFGEEIVDIADDSSGDVNRDRLRVDTRKWLMARMAPKKYGDRTTAELTGNLTLSLADLVNASYQPEQLPAPEMKTVEGKET